MKVFSSGFLRLSRQSITPDGLLQTRAGSHYMGSLKKHFVQPFRGAIRMKCHSWPHILRLFVRQPIYDSSSIRLRVGLRSGGFPPQKFMPISAHYHCSILKGARNIKPEIAWHGEFLFAERGGGTQPTRGWGVDVQGGGIPWQELPGNE